MVKKSRISPDLVATIHSTLIHFEWRSLKQKFDENTRSAGVLVNISI
jgi:hypothetical protein